MDFSFSEIKGYIIKSFKIAEYFGNIVHFNYVLHLTTPPDMERGHTSTMGLVFEGERNVPNYALGFHPKSNFNYITIELLLLVLCLPEYQPQLLLQQVFLHLLQLLHHSLFLFLLLLFSRKLHRSQPV